MTGFWVDGGDRALMWGGPADGTLCVVDDPGGTIWRVFYVKNAAAPANQPQCCLSVDVSALLSIRRVSEILTVQAEGDRVWDLGFRLLYERPGVEHE